MNVFEDLIVELKEANLLEDTILDEDCATIDDLDVTALPNREFDASAAIAASKPRRDAPYGSNGTPANDEAQIQGPDTDDDAEAVADIAPIVTRSDEAPDAPVQDKPKKKSSEFFKKRAIAEVSGLQMVEHVLTGVEREYMKVKPNTFDDFNAKMGLNKFLQVADGPADSEEHKAAEFALMQETESWGIALSERDRGISVSSLRQYCENTRPALSSQALLSLCRFYRNLPFSEAVRAKYDFLITRLFSRPSAGDKRVCLFTRDEATGHLKTLYQDWSSVPIYTADEDDGSQMILAALSFDELAQESENAGSFDQLIESDFFGRLRMFKESISETFFAPLVAVAAIEANVRIGNAYVKLIAAERERMDADSIQAKYGGFDHESVSDATARTLELVDLLKAPTFDAAEDPKESAQNHIAEVIEHRNDVRRRDDVKQDDLPAEPSFISGLMANAFSVNKWFLTAAIALIAASAGLYIWANYVVDETPSTVGIKTVTDTPLFREHIKSAKVSNEILYGLLLPTWESLPKEKRQEYVQK
ncbi:MAG TPA: hypothetical protein VGO43_09340, partial [Pyrinomonadaceae bacterium]|nr:hypothetical protein [Pyrinomonadaceae bacterium]